MIFVSWFLSHYLFFMIFQVISWGFLKSQVVLLYWDLGFLSWLDAGSMGTLLSPCFNASGWPQKKTTSDEVVVVKSVGFWTFVWTARGRLHWGSPVVTWRDGSDVRLRSFLLAPKCPLERRLATRFLGRSWALEVIVVVVGSWKMGFLVGIFWNEIPVGYDFMF